MGSILKILTILVGMCLIILFTSGCTQRLTLVGTGSSSEPSTSFLPSPAPTFVTDTPSPIPTETPIPDLGISQTIEEENGGIVTPVIVIDSTDAMTEVHVVEWEVDSMGLNYALGNGFAHEPKDWTWWHYDLGTGTKTALPAPPAQVSDTIRAELGLCLEPDPNCWSETALFESPSGTLMAYAPPGSRGEYGNGELWVANTDGTNRRLISTYLSGVVEWSPREDFLLVDIGWDWPDVSLVRVDSLQVRNLLDLAGVRECTIPHAAPHFSPDGRKIAFVGAQTIEGTETCYLWEMDLDNSNIRQLSEHVGGIQWSMDSQYLYVLEHRYRSRNVQEFALYRIDTHSLLPEGELLIDTLPYYGFLTRRIPWAVSPNETMIVYTDVYETGTLGIVRFAPAP